MQQWLRHLGIGLSGAALVLYGLWWLATTIGVIVAVALLVYNVVLPTSFEAQDLFTQLYSTGGAIVLALALLRFGRSILSLWLDPLRRADSGLEGFIEWQAMTIVFGGGALLLIVLTYIAWPVTLLLIVRSLLPSPHNDDPS